MTIQRKGLPNLAAIVRRRFENPAPFLNETEDEVATRLGRPIVRQLTKKDSAPGGYQALRMSSIGGCARQLAYRLLGEAQDGRKMTGRTVATFAMGDITESLLLTGLDDGMAQGHGPDGWKVAGLRQVTGQHNVSLTVRLDGLRMPIKINGHPDGILTKDGKPVAVVEVKSTSSYGYTKAEQAIKNGGDAWTPVDGQWWQAQSYMEATGLQWLSVLMLCKDSGAFMSWWIERDPEFMNMLRKHLGRVIMGEDVKDVPRITAGNEELKPSQPEYYRRSGKGYTKGQQKRGSGALPWRCCYCEFYRTCWGGHLDERVESDRFGSPSTKLYFKELI